MSRTGESPVDIVRYGGRVRRRYEEALTRTQMSLCGAALHECLLMFVLGN